MRLLPARFGCDLARRPQLFARSAERVCPARSSWLSRSLPPQPEGINYARENIGNSHHVGDASVEPRDREAAGGGLEGIFGRDSFVVAEGFLRHRITETDRVRGETG